MVAVFFFAATCALVFGKTPPPTPAALPAVHVVYNYDSEGSTVQDLEQRQEVEAMEERLTNLTVRMHERKALLDSILANAKSIAPRRSFALRRTSSDYDEIPPASLLGVAPNANASTFELVDEQAVQEHLNNLSARMRERKAVLDSLIARAKGTLPQQSFLLRRSSHDHGEIPSASLLAMASDANSSSSEMLLELDKFASELDKSLEAGVNAFSAMVETEARRSEMRRGDKIPCLSQVECDQLASEGTGCANQRVFMMTIYDQINVGINIFGQVIAKMCGCIFASKLQLCFLGPTPICAPPFGIYLTIFGMSAAMWEAVKLSTKMCSVIGDPLIASIR